ncbi:hypothetical protein Adeg_1543 [Ammonifex degensii KC4]|uniref:DUF4321 domain-containing protein n=1 Tax=Ammonifex degensii (strain DSM 10501 / KC4) TaxID=429009 RepID=C9R8K9_AMMDK|nr:DUF4321 domain-containing protein [Ammonifex degensii]ACX52638.1 hypothetical protein Adeg_1543 [Ammonifex degensii KC4]
MARGQRTQHGKGTLILMLFMGGLAGSVLGEGLGTFFPFLKNTAAIGFGPATLDLHFCKCTLGFSLALGPATVLGLLAGYWAYRRI